MIDPQPGDRVRMTLIGTFGYDRHDRSPILTVRNGATGAIYEVPVHVEAAFTPAEASAAALAEAIRDANIGWDEMQNSVTAETWPGTWDEWVADALIEAGYIATSPAASTPGTATYDEIYSMLDLMRDGSVSQDAMAAMLHRRLVPPASSPALKESAESFNSAAGNAGQREQAERDTEVERLRAEAIRHGERATEEFGRAEELIADLTERTRERDDALRRHHNLAHLTAPDVFAAAQRQDMVRLPADARGEIERLLTANVGKPAGGVAHKLMLLLTDDWRASPTSTEDPADTCDCAGEQCAGPREICAAFPTEPESLKAQYSVRSLDYIRELYRVPAEVDGRVIFDGDPGKITGALGPYLLVLLDGDDEPMPVHPTWHMSYAATEDEGGEH